MRAGGGGAEYLIFMYNNSQESARTMGKSFIFLQSAMNTLDLFCSRPGTMGKSYSHKA